MKKTIIVSGFITLSILAGCSQAGGNAGPNSGAGIVQTKVPGASGSQPNAVSMQPQTPAALTDQQSQELAAGKAAHNPTTLTFDVTGGSFYFTPNEIHVKKGDTVKIVFNNAGGMHNFMLDEFDVKIDTIKIGETATATFVADKTGSFEYYCGVGKHRQMGQKGALIVE